MTWHSLRAFGFVLLALTSESLWSGGARATTQPVVVVVAAASPLKDMSLGTLRRVFIGEVVEDSEGKRLLPINHPLESDTRIVFDRAVLGLKPTEVGRFWIDRKIRNQSSPPKSVPSVELALRVVMSLPGGITYASADSVNNKLRVLTIDGKQPHDPGYPLHE